MTNKDLFYFIGKCLMLEEDPSNSKEITVKIELNLIDWQKFVNQCSNHLVLPSIYLKFKSHGILAHLPVELAEYLHDIYSLNLERNRQILNQLGEITALLNRNDIFPLFLKGSGNLIDGIYGDQGERMMGDIDFLVPEKDYLSTAKLLEDDGYRMTVPYYQDVKGLKHYPRIIKNGSPAAVEIHRLPVTDLYRSWFGADMVDRDKRPAPLLLGAFVLSDEHKIILNFIHGQLDHEGHLYGIVSFRDLYDLYLFSRRTSLNESLKNMQSTRKAVAYFALTRKAFGLDSHFFSRNNLSARLLSKRHELNMRSKIFYFGYRSFVYLFNRVIIGITSQIIQSFYKKEIRRSVFARMSDLTWYRASLHSYVSFFKRGE